MSAASIAQTNLQLYNQMLVQGRSIEELARAKSAYDLACLIYSAHYQADGKPFVAHTVGVASILCHLGLPSEVIAFGLVHNIYGNGDFGDGRQHRSTPARRRRVREAVGPERLWYTGFATSGSPARPSIVSKPNSIHTATSSGIWS